MFFTLYCADQKFSVSKLLGFKTFAKSLRVSVSENLVSEKKSWFRFQKNLVSEKSLGFGKFGFGKKVSVSVLENFGLGKKSRFRQIWSQKRKNLNNKNSARSDVPNLGLGPNWD